MRVPARLATDLYVKALVAKIAELEDRVKALEKDASYVRGTLQQILSIVGAGAKRAEVESGRGI